ncbi:MAG: hypothetical protein Q8N14_04075 [Candidatus Omnitrophota bacterium]|nr:hypothetical protein [Candidatus Omnitrophota bacterium]
MTKPLASSSKPVALSEVSVEANMDSSVSALLLENPASEKERERGVWSSFGIWGFEFED